MPIRGVEQGRKLLSEMNSLVDDHDEFMKSLAPGGMRCSRRWAGFILNPESSGELRIAAVKRRILPAVPRRVGHAEYDRFPSFARRICFGICPSSKRGI